MNPLIARGATGCGTPEGPARRLRALALFLLLAILAFMAGGATWPHIYEQLPLQDVPVRNLSEQVVFPPRAADPHLLAATRAGPSAGIKDLVDAVSPSRLLAHICHLQDDDHQSYCNTRGSRYSYNSQGLNEAAEYIYAHFAGLGLSVEYAPFVHSGTVMTNVIATLAGVDPRSDEVFIVSAHYDSTSGNPFLAAPGADDDASGTAVVLEAAQVLSQESFDHTIRFVAFAGEEQGLVGSDYYAASARARGDNIGGVIQLDMVGWDSNGDRRMELHAGMGSASGALADMFINALSTYHISLIPEKLTWEATDRSDHASFWAREYPAILVIEDSEYGSTEDFNPYYHTASDTLDKLDITFTTSFAKAVVASLSLLAQDRGFTDTTLPVSAITHPQNGHAYNRLTDISGTASDDGRLQKVQVSIERNRDNRFWDSTTWISPEMWLDATGNISWSMSSGLPAWSTGESYTIRSRAIDDSGNVENPGSGNTFVFDTEPPAILSPAIVEDSPYLHAKGTTLYFGTGMRAPQPFIVQGDAVDSDGAGLDRATFSTAFGVTPPDDITPQTWSGEYRISNTDVTEGTIVVTGYDQAGNSQDQSFSYVKDVDAPVSSATAPRYVNNGEIPVAWSAQDSGSGTWLAWLWFRKGSSDWTESQLPPVDASSGMFLFAPAGEGTYHFATVSMDNVGNRGDPPTGLGQTSTIYDVTPPLSTLTVPPHSSTNSFLVSWDASDPLPGSGLAPEGTFDVQYKVDVGPWLNWLSGTTLKSALFGPNNPVAVNAGQIYHFRVRAKDAAGNQGVFVYDATRVQRFSIYLPVVNRSLLKVSSTPRPPVLP